MELSRRVAYCGQQLDEIDPSIVIRGVEVGTPEETIGSASRMSGVGQRITNSHYETMEIAVIFGIDVPKKDLKLRQSVYDRVVAWALQSGSKKLEVNYVENRIMQVDKVILPGSGDLRDWTADFRLIFRAYNVPFWQDLNPVKIAMNGMSGDAWSVITGNIRTVVNVRFTNRSGMRIEDLKVGTDEAFLQFESLSLNGNEKLVIDHQDGLMRAKKIVGDRTESVMAYIHYSSSDDLYISPGGRKISFSADRYGEWMFEIYGRYL
jgi:hypothetical protein